MKPSPAAAARGRRSPLANPKVVAPIALLLLAALAWGVVRWRGAAADANAREALLADVEAATGKEPPDGGELSRLTAMLRKLPDHDSAHDLLAAAARIELARGRPERAHELFGSIAGRPGATAREQGLGARILLRLHEAEPSDPGVARGMLRQVMDMADASYRESHDPADLLRAWQAATRAGEQERAAAAAASLQAQHGDAPQARFVHFAQSFRPEVGVAAVDRALDGLAPQPPEGAALRAWAQLQAGDVAAAVTTAEAGLARAPGVGTVRLTAAIVFHACVQGSPAGSDERASWLARRDAQIAWVLRQEPRNEAWARQCLAMRDVR